MTENCFTPEVAEAIGIYVYRLIDPRNGETFYVGKGRGNRVFEHARGELQGTSGDEGEDPEDLKMRRITEIRNGGLEVMHLIHRHGITDDATAYQIEAALIDAYPGLSNRVAGHRSGDYGVRHTAEIIKEYSTEAFVPQQSLILINISRSAKEDGRNLYDAVRGVWRINKNKAERYGLVLAHSHGIVQGAYIPTKPWLAATVLNFPWLETDLERWGFEGEQAPPEIWQLYVGKRVPAEYRKKGAASPSAMSTSHAAATCLGELATWSFINLSALPRQLIRLRL